MIPTQNPRAAFADLDLHFAAFIGRFGGGERVERAAACLSRAVREGHICLDLRVAPEWVPQFQSQTTDPNLSGRWPDYSAWRDALAQSRAVSGPGESGAVTPLVLDDSGRLYLRRYYEYEQSLVGALRARGAARTGPASMPVDQETAIEAALQQSLSIVSGGPGTGKTTTVVAILARILEQHPTARIALAATTGKAAVRLEQAVAAWFPAESDFATRIPRASTLHVSARARALTVFATTPQTRSPSTCSSSTKSMAPLPLMAKLFDALQPATRVVLLGDCDQLASVEPCNVLADIAEAAQEPASPLVRPSRRVEEKLPLRQRERHLSACPSRSLGRHRCRNRVARDRSRSSRIGHRPASSGHHTFRAARRNDCRWICCHPRRVEPGPGAACVQRLSSARGPSGVDHTVLRI